MRQRWPDNVLAKGKALFIVSLSAQLNDLIVFPSEESDNGMLSDRLSHAQPSESFTMDANLIILVLWSALPASWDLDTVAVMAWVPESWLCFSKNLQD